ncbi:hypothetical protein GY45DRAFT_1366231 [Cubamyces sp. BRFM 1775]|nr:hypothetical protein GY45DRAFT_1366231 [Cubamyces sp. BRFM 1775]
MKVPDIRSHDPTHARPWHMISSAAVFEESESLEDIRRDICLLTTMMATHKIEPTRSATSADREEIDGHIREQVRRLRHISTLLSIGGYNNTAVGTANILHAEIEPNYGAAGKKEIVPTEGRGKYLLENWFEARGSDIDTVPADQHLEDMVAIMHYFRGITDPVALSASTFALTKFITCRARYQLACRLRGLTGTKLWAKNPVAIVKQWFGQVDPSVHDGRSVALSLANVLQWVAALEGLIYELKIQFPRSVLDAHSNKLEPWPIKERDVVKIALVLFRLEHLLNTSFLLALEDLRPGLAAKLRESHLYAQEAQKLSKMMNPFWMMTMAGLRVWCCKLSTLMAAQASSVIEDHEDGIEHLQRFLRSIVAWHAACYALTSDESTKRPLRVFKYTKSPQLELVEPHVEAFVNRYLGCLNQQCEDGTISTPLKECVRYTVDKGKPGNYASPYAETVLSKSKLHAEASLIALAHSTSYNLDAELPKSLFKFTSPVAVVVSNQCCWCCNTLAKLLGGETSQRFILPEAHAKILPWVPPAEVPIPVLKKIRNDLFDIFNKWICSNTLSSVVSNL